MKAQIMLAASALVAGTAFYSSGAHAVIRDSLSGGDIEMRQSALTSPGNSNWVLNASDTKQIWSWSSKSWGNARFGAGYSAQGVTAAWAAGGSNAQNFFSASATAFGDTRQVISGSVSAATNGPNQTSEVQATVSILGNQIRNVKRGGADFVTAPTLLTHVNQKVYDATSQPFWIGPIRMKAGASVNVTAGQSVLGHVWVDGIEARLSQSAGLAVTAWAGADYWVAAGGIKLKDLGLMTASLDLDSKGRYENHGAGSGGCGAVYTLGHTYGLRLRELDGAVVAWGRLFGFYDEYELFRMEGFTQFFPIDSVAPFSGPLGGCFPVPVAPQVGGYIVS